METGTIKNNKSTYKFLKLNSSTIKKYYTSEIVGNGEYEIKLNYREAVKNSYIISMAESQLIRHLQDMGRINEMYAMNKKGKTLSYKRKVSFIPDIVYILFDDESVFTKMRNQNLKKKKYDYAFILNGIKYSRLFTSSSNGRKSTSTYINNNIKDELLKKCMNGLILEELHVNSNKFNAYVGLCTSSSDKVSQPRVCVVEDFKLPVRIKSIFVEENKLYKDGKEKPVTNYSDNFVIEYDVVKESINNCFDGMGLIDPIFASEVWAKDLELDYTPCGWVIRQAFLKGAVFNMDFKKLAKTRENPIEYITDIYGKQHCVDCIDIILTESQFKMARQYQKQYEELGKDRTETWQYYLDCCAENNNTWGVSKVSPKQEDDEKATNYQFLQTLKLTDEEIASLCKPSIDYLDSCIDNPNVLFSLDNYKNSSKGIPPYVQAMHLYEGAIKDPYIISEIQDIFRGQIKDMCLGRLKAKGNYQFMIADPMALCEWAFYKDEAMVKGLLKENEYYSKYWLDKGFNKVAAVRAPNIHFSEHNTLDLINNDDVADWYSHLPSGIIYNIFGDDCLRHSGSDNDGDTVYTSSSSELLNGTIASPVIDFIHPEPKKVVLTERELFKADKIGFGTDIGGTVNLATICINMKDKYSKDSQEYKELARREILLTYLGQLTIDAQKGCSVPDLPEHWYKYQPILSENYYKEKFNRKTLVLSGITIDELEKKESPNEKEAKILKQYTEEKKIIDTDEIAAAKTFNNSILLNKKPYFHIYKYKELRKKYMEYKESLVLRNPKENPLNENESIMNKVCWAIEKNDYERKLALKHKCDTVDEKWIELMRSERIRRSLKRYEAIKKLHREYTSARSLANNKAYSGTDDKMFTFAAIDECYGVLFLEQAENESDLANILIELLYVEQPKKTKDALWKFAGNAVVENIKKNLEVLNG